MVSVRPVDSGLSLARRADDRWSQSWCSREGSPATSSIDWPGLNARYVFSSRFCTHRHSITPNHSISEAIKRIMILGNDDVRRSTPRRTQDKNGGNGEPIRSAWISSYGPGGRGDVATAASQGDMQHARRPPSPTCCSAPAVREMRVKRESKPRVAGKNTRLGFYGLLN